MISFDDIPIVNKKAPPVPVSRGRTALEQGLAGATFNLADEAYNRLGALGAGIYQAASDLPMESQDPYIGGVNLGAVGRFGNTLQALTDEASAETNKRMAEQLSQRPALSIGANIGGALLTGGAGATTKTGQALTNSLRSGNLALRTGKAATLGAATGSAAGFGAGNGFENRLESAGDSAVAGGIIGGAIPVVGATAGKLAKGAKTARVGVAARGRDEYAEALSGMKDKVASAYNKIDEAGAVLSNDAGAELANSLDKNLAKLDLIPELNPKTIAVVNRIKSAIDEGGLKVSKVDQYRRLLSGIKDEDGAAASAARGAIDDFLDSIDTSKLSGGDANIGAYLRDARAAASQRFKFQRVTDVLNRADGDPNKIKSGLTSLLNKKGGTAGMSKDEVAALRAAASSTTSEKMLKMLGKFGFDFGTSLTAGNTVAPVVGAAVGGAAGSGATAGLVPAAGTVARYGQKALARGKAENLLRTIEGAAAPAAKTSLPVTQSAAPANAIRAAQTPVAAGVVAGSASAQPKQPTRIEVNPNQPNPYAPLPEVNLPPSISFDDIPMLQQPAPRSALPQEQSSLTDKIAMAESSGNPNAQSATSSASGLYQFTDSTWRSAVDKWGRRYGIKYGDKNDPQAQEQMMQYLLKDNARILQNKGIEPTDANLYFAHFMGAPAASKAINMLGKNAIAARSFPTAAKANKSIFYDGKRPRTIEEVYELITSKVA